MNICNLIRNIHTTDRIYDYISSLDLADMINEKLSLCKTKEECISILQNIHPKMDVVSKAFATQRPELIKVQALLP